MPESGWLFGQRVSQRLLVCKGVAHPQILKVHRRAGAATAAAAPGCGPGGGGGRRLGCHRCLHVQPQLPQGRVRRGIRLGSSRLNSKECCDVVRRSHALSLR